MPLCLECLSFFKNLRKRTMKKITSLKEIIIIKNDNKKESFILRPNKCKDHISISSEGSEEIIYERKDIPNIIINDYDKEFETNELVNQNEKNFINNKKIICDTKSIISNSAKENDNKNNKEKLNELIKELEEKNRMNQEVLEKLNKDLFMEKDIKDKDIKDKDIKDKNIKDKDIKDKDIKDKNIKDKDIKDKNIKQNFKDKFSDDEYDNLTFNIIQDEELVNTSYYKNKKLRNRKFKKISIDSDEEWQEWNELI